MDECSSREGLRISFPQPSPVRFCRDGDANKYLILLVGAAGSERDLISAAPSRRYSLSPGSCGSSSSVVRVDAIITDATQARASRRPPRRRKGRSRTPSRHVTGNARAVSADSAVNARRPSLIGGKCSTRRCARSKDGRLADRGRDPNRRLGERRASEAHRGRLCDAAAHAAGEATVRPYRSRISGWQTTRGPSTFATSSFAATPGRLPRLNVGWVPSHKTAIAAPSSGNPLRNARSLHVMPAPRFCSEVELRCRFKTARKS
jgi:hypothetical protein